MKRCLALALFLVSLVSAAQVQIPAGTILPIQLSRSINSRRAKAGQKISARLMQPVDLGSGQELRRGTRIEGVILSADPYHVTLAFDRAIVDDQPIAVHTSLRALASMMDVQDAQLPTNTVGGDRGSSIQDWNTNPIGGGVLYNAYGGTLFEGNRVVGHSPNGGIVAHPIATDACSNENPLTEQAFWIFSPAACGLYGFDDLRIAHTGRDTPVGHITLQSHQPFVIRGGSGLLLRVVD